MLKRTKISYNNVLLSGLFLNDKIIGAASAYFLKDYLQM
jgi:hypothetical protein